ncbi:MAG: SurA N-terminal domain-containing protein, partial [Phycisphaerales bacterium]
MIITPKHLSLLIVFALILCIGCEPETKVHVLSDPTDESAATQPQTEPEVEAEAAETSVEVAKAEEKMRPVEEPAELEEKMPTEAPVETEEQVTADEVAVTVNGTEITEGDLDKMIQPQLDRMLARTRGRKRPDNFIEDTKKRLHGQALDAAIINALVEQDLAKNNIVVTEEQINQHIQEMAEQQGMTVDDLKSLIESSGKTFEQWKEQMQFDKRLAVLELVKNRGLG